MPPGHSLVIDDIERTSAVALANYTSYGEDRLIDARARRELYDGIAWKVRHPANCRACRLWPRRFHSRQRFAQALNVKITITGENVGESGLGGSRRHAGAGEGLVAPSQCDASKCPLSTIVCQADRAIVEQTGEVVPASEHVACDRF